MRILLVGNYIPDAQQSMQRFAALLQRGLTEAGHDVRVVYPPVVAGKLHGAPGGKWFAYIDKFLLFPSILRRASAWADVVHICDHSNSFYVGHVNGKPHVVTCHDMLAVRRAMGDVAQKSKEQTKWTGRQYQKIIVDGLTRAQHIVCVSDATKHDLQRIVTADGPKISRIYNGLNYPYTPMDRLDARSRLYRLGLDGGRFIFHVGGNQWYKNRLGLLHIFSTIRKYQEAQDLKLVMAGKPWPRELRDFVRQEKLERAVFELTGVDEEDLRALYSSAELMLYPSLEEGFGWPVAEAQSCGCAVVTSNRAPMTEVGGEGALYVDPTHCEAAAEAVLAALKNKRDLREKGLLNSRRFATRHMVDAYASLYSGLLNSAKGDLVPDAVEHEGSKSYH